MININVLVNINGTKEQKESLYIPEDAIDEFLRTGFAQNIYEARVIYEFRPQAVSPDLLEIIIDIIDEVKDIGDDAGKILNIIAAVKFVIEFAKKTKGYCVNIYLKYKEGKGKMINISLDENVNEIEEKIKKEVDI